MAERVAAASHAADNDPGYADMERLVAERVGSHKGPLFTTEADPETLWSAYLDNIPEARR